MNRAERRRRGIQSKPAVLNMTEQQYKNEMIKISERVAERTREDTIKTVVNFFCAVTSLALNNEFQFGKGRINKLMDRIHKEIQCVDYGSLTAADVRKWCDERNIIIPNMVKESPPKGKLA